MKHKVILSSSEIQTIINELETAIDATDNYNHAMYLANLVKKLENCEGSSFYSRKPNKPLTGALAHGR
jgi:hypothetical protein